MKLLFATSRRSSFSLEKPSKVLSPKPLDLILPVSSSMMDYFIVFETLASPRLLCTLSANSPFET
jgi:hypothetical protein